VYTYEWSINNKTTVGCGFTWWKALPFFDVADDGLFQDSLSPSLSLSASLILLLHTVLL
jgi:hypothetical protein